MTARLYASEKQGHGGKRARCVQRVLSPEQIQAIRIARAFHTPSKVLMRQFGCSRKTLWRAANGCGAYTGSAADTMEQVKQLIADAARWRAHVAELVP